MEILAHSGPLGRRQICIVTSSTVKLGRKVGQPSFHARFPSSLSQGGQDRRRYLLDHLGGVFR